MRSDAFNEGEPRRGSEHQVKPFRSETSSTRCAQCRLRLAGRAVPTPDEPGRIGRAAKRQSLRLKELRRQ